MSTTPTPNPPGQTSVPPFSMTYPPPMDPATFYAAYDPTYHVYGDDSYTVADYVADEWASYAVNGPGINYPMSLGLDFGLPLYSSPPSLQPEIHPDQLLLQSTAIKTLLTAARTPVGDNRDGQPFPLYRLLLIDESLPIFGAPLINSPLIDPNDLLLGLHELNRSNNKSHQMIHNIEALTWLFGDIELAEAALADPRDFLTYFSFYPISKKTKSSDVEVRWLWPWEARYPEDLLYFKLRSAPANLEMKAGWPTTAQKEKGATPSLFECTIPVGLDKKSTYSAATDTSTTTDRIKRATNHLMPDRLRASFTLNPRAPKPRVPRWLRDVEQEREIEPALPVPTLADFAPLIMAAVRLLEEWHAKAEEQKEVARQLKRKRLEEVDQMAKRHLANRVGYFAEGEEEATLEEILKGNASDDEESDGKMDNLEDEEDDDDIKSDPAQYVERKLSNLGKYGFSAREFHLRLRQQFGERQDIDRIAAAMIRKVEKIADGIMREARHEAGCPEDVPDKACESAAGRIAGAGMEGDGGEC